MAMNAQKLEELIVHLGGHPEVKNLGLTKLWKLIYFIDSEASRDGGVSVTGSEFINYEHGPVPSRGNKHLKRLAKEGAVKTTQRQIGNKFLNEVRSSRKSDESAFSAKELGIIDTVCARYGSETAVNLSKISHREPAWHYSERMGKLCPILMQYGQEEDPDGL
jgi:uncharacterized phage-associated protein